MKRSEMLEHIEEETKEFLEFYEVSTTKARPHKVKAFADRILCMLEGFDMKPPGYFDIDYYDEPECDGYIYEWENEDK